MLTYRHTDTLEVVGFSYIFMMAEGVVSWNSVKRTLITSSTMEIEYVACYEANCHAICLRNFISTLEVVHSIPIPLELFYDDSAVVSFFRNTRSDRIRPEYPSRVPRVVPPSGVLLYNP